MRAGPSVLIIKCWWEELRCFARSEREEKDTEHPSARQRKVLGWVAASSSESGSTESLSESIRSEGWSRSSGAGQGRASKEEGASMGSAAGAWVPLNEVLCMCAALIER